MKTIFLVRHAKSSWKNPELSDHERPLLDVGKKRTKKVIDFLIEQNAKPDLIISSSAKRCKETAGFLARGLSYPVNEIQPNPSIYKATRQTLVNIFYDLADNLNSVMIVGHDPALTNFINSFPEISIDYLPTSAVVCLVFDTEKWDTIQNSPYFVKYVVFPKHLSKSKSI